MAGKTGKLKNTFRSSNNASSELDGNELSWKIVGDSLRSQRLKKIIGLFLLVLGAFLTLASISYLFTWRFDDALLDGQVINWSLLSDRHLEVENFMGRLGAIGAHALIKQAFGIASFLILMVMCVAGIRLLFGIRLWPMKKTLAYSAFFLVWTAVFFGFFTPSGQLQLLGGAFGFEACRWLEGLMGRWGTLLLLIFSLGTFVILIFNPNFSALLKGIQSWLSRGERPGAKEGPDDAISDWQSDDDAVGEADLISQLEEKDEEAVNRDESREEKAAGQSEEEALAWSVPEDVGGNENDHSSRPPLEIETGGGKISGRNYESIDDPFGNEEGDLPDLSHLGAYDPTLDLPNYRIPSLKLLDERGSDSVQVNKKEVEDNKDRIIDTLNNYSIQIDRIKATVGPTVTLYEIIPAPGVRISKIKNLENDIALSLSALGIRIIAPIPGRGTIGIEVPNSNPEIVSMKSILASEQFQQSMYELPIGLGKTIANETFIADLTRMPHLLMAGATGQGKSVGLNAVLASILYKKHPATVKFVLVDPKKVELNLYSKIERHFLAKLPDAEEAIVTETRQVVRTLNSLCIEMDNRYNLLKDAQTRNIKEYNAKFIARRLNPNQGHRFLPYIILFIDEFADLIMIAGREVELPIARLAQLSRAVGLHLIISTQRPSVNIITGTIKANFPARIAFRVTSKIDSRTILDSGGAEQLVGRGDMLLSTGSDLIRLQCAFIDTPEIERITDFIGSQRAYPDALHLPEYYDEEDMGADNMDPADRDELFKDAARIIVATQQGSTSLLQRKLKLGYNRAGRIIDQLEAAGIVGPFEGSKAREVKIKDELSLEQFLNNQEEQDMEP